MREGLYPMATMVPQRRVAGSSPETARRNVVKHAGFSFPNRPPPPIVRPVPADRLTQTRVEWLLWHPTEALLRFRPVNRVALNVPGPVIDVPEQGVTLPELLQDLLPD